jgi:diguanylate cyclase (GGDEF)-like protein
VLSAIAAFPSNLLRLLGRQAPLFVGALVLSGAVAGGAYGLADYLYAYHVKEASDALKNLSFVISDHSNRSMLAVNQSVSKVVDALQTQKPNTVAALETLADAPALRQMLDDIVVDNPFLDSVFVIGADGRVDQRSRASMIPPDVIAGTDFMASLRRAQPGGFFLSSPFESYQFRTWMVNFSRRISAPDGAFLGAVAGIVKLSSFSDLFDKVNLQAKGSMALVAGDGQLLSWAPQAEMPFGPTLAGSAIYDEFIRPRRDGVTRAQSPYDGVERLLAIANSPDFPVAVMIGMGMPDVVAEGTSETHWIARTAGIVILAILLGVARLAYGLERHAAQRERRIIDRQKAAQAEVLSNAIENIVQGLAMFDKRGLLVLYNTRYAEMYGLLKSDLVCGVAREELPARLNRNGQAKTFERAIKEPDGSVLTHNHLQDGRVIARRKRALPDGGWITTHEDVSERRAAEARIRQLAARDALTGLFNRFEFREQLERRLEEARIHGAKFAVFYLDLDRFKLINEASGHYSGDEALRQTAERLAALAGPEDSAFRLGGDEFALIQTLEASPRDAEQLAERLIARFAEPLRIDGAEVACGASAGVCLIPPDGGDVESVIRNVDIALQHAKQNGRGRYSFFASSMREQVASRLKLESDLKAAIAQRQFELFYQPIVSLKDDGVVSFEALIRWRHPQRGLVPPADFIPVAEETGLIVQIGDWAMREACRKAAAWPSHLKVAVNVSPLQFRAPGFLAAVTSALSDAGITGSRLIAEITENVMIKDAEQAIAALHALKKLGVAVSMDDFGTGYSSLSYLRKFPFDKMKIDKTFVGGLGADPSAATIVKAAIALANALGIGSVAEGIETEEQMAFLAEAGCLEAQGYLIGRPMPSTDADAFLARGAKERPQVVGNPLILRHVTAEQTARFAATARA